MEWSPATPDIKPIKKKKKRLWFWDIYGNQNQYKKKKAIKTPESNVKIETVEK